MALAEEIRIARHEAAHAIAALELGGTAKEIDLCAQNSPNGLGAVQVSYEDPSQRVGKARKQATMSALIVICAGAANDALELSEPLQTAWNKQVTGDGIVATKLLNNLGIDKAAHHALIECALCSARSFVHYQRKAIIALGELATLKNVIFEDDILECYNIHKIT